MKKLIILFLIFLLSLNFSHAKTSIKKSKEKIPPKNVVAPAIQFNSEDYKNYFKKDTDFKVYLKTFSDYKITCDSEIVGINFGDRRNIKIYDKKDKNNEIIDMKSTVIMLKNETYSYIRLYKITDEVVNIILNVNPAFEEKQNINLGLCKIEPYRG